MIDRTTPAMPDQADYAAVHGDIVALLDAARHAAARSVNAVMTASYWEIGCRIVEFEQGGKGRAGYGETLIERLSADLTSRFGRGFSKQNLWQMRAFTLRGQQARFFRHCQQNRPPREFPRHRLENLPTLEISRQRLCSR